MKPERFPQSKPRRDNGGDLYNGYIQPNTTRMPMRSAKTTSDPHQKEAEIASPFFRKIFSNFSKTIEKLSQKEGPEARFTMFFRKQKLRLSQSKLEAALARFF